MEFKEPIQPPMENPSSERISEPSVETKKGAMEKAQEGRFKLAFNVFLRLGSHAIDIIPIGNFKMLPEMALGVTVTGKKLNKKDRIMYGLIILGSFIYSTLFTYGIAKGDVNKIMLAFPVYMTTVGLTIKQKGAQIKEDIPEFIIKYGETLNEHLLAFSKIIEEYGFENAKKLIERMRNKK